MRRVPSAPLPPGIHVRSWTEVKAAFGTTHHRRRLLGGLRAAMEALKAAGCERVYLDGSFISRTRHPDDFDGCWDPTNVNLSLLDPVLQDFSSGRRAQKAKYRGELFPSSATEGISGLTFLQFLQQDKDTGAAKGIIQIDLRTV